MFATLAVEGCVSKETDIAADTHGVVAPATEVSCPPSSEGGVATTGVLPAILASTKKVLALCPLVVLYKFGKLT